MIHQFIFASPKPGMTEKAFLDYWIHVHAVRYASKIPQIRRYLIDSRVPFPGQTSPEVCSGVAEIWLENEEDQLASLQSKELIEGARKDEPNWAAFWRTFVLDTDTHVILEGARPERDSGQVKLFALVKRKPGMSLEEFRRYSLDVQARKTLKLPGLRRYVQCHTRDSFYGIGEALLDCVSLFWFDDVAAVEAMLASPENTEATADLACFVDPTHTHLFLASETWIIGPEPRPAAREAEIVRAVANGDEATVRRLLGAGVGPNIRDPASGLTLLMIAAGRSNVGMVELLVKAGADLFATDDRAGATALHKACQGGSVAVARLLVEEGVPVDAVVATTGHTPLIDAIWFKKIDVVEYLLSRGTGLNITTHYGFTLDDHIAYGLAANAEGKDELLRAKARVEQRRRADAAAVRSQTLMAAVKAGNLEAVNQAIRSGAEVDARSPILNGFEDRHTPLLVASRDGHAEIVSALLAAGADVNAVEPTFGAVPLHKAVYNGHTEITRILTRQPGVHLDAQGPANGYTPLLDSIWHGWDGCAAALIGAGARLDIEGHDGKSPLALATEIFGPDHTLVRQIETKLGSNENRSTR